MSDSKSLTCISKTVKHHTYFETVKLKQDLCRNIHHF